ncbi:MAG: DUF3800 domain-containing protein [Chthoniobacterales bacterium]
MQSALSSGRLDTIQEKVAWILNRYPSARDSDITLQLKYWENFEPELAPGSTIQKQDLYKLGRLTSLSRARAKIQNQYHLFKASSDVQKRRGVLEQEERDKAREQQIDSPAISVYEDESGKNETHLVIGSVWFLHPHDELKFLRDIYQWKRDRDFSDELHFKNISNSNIDHYLSFAEFLGDRTAVISFKSVTMERRGVDAEDALAEMRYLLLVEGLQHEDSTGRAPLPRALLVTKDSENEAQDRLALASLADRLKQAAASRFGNRLVIDQLSVGDSKGTPLLQVADLFTSSVRRVLQSTELSRPKDRFARRLLECIGIPRGPEDELTAADMILHIKL